MRPALDRWMPEPAALRVLHTRRAHASADQLWAAAAGVRLREAGLLGRLVRWRIPGLGAELTFDEMFREPPFVVLEQGDRWLVSGLVGRIWTLRRDYPRLGSPSEFGDWSQPGTARVVFALWADEDLGRRHGAQEAQTGATSLLGAEARVQALGAQGRLGVAAVRPLVATFGPLVGSEGLAVAVRRAESRP